MAVLNIRNLPDEVHARLRVRAARAGRSMEAEARAILEAAMAGEPSEPQGHGDGFRELKALVDRLYGPDMPKNVVEELIAERRRETERDSAALAAELDRIAMEAAALPVLDDRTADEIIGYDESGLPT